MQPGSSPPPSHSIHSIRRTVFWGRGQYNDWSLNLAAAFSSRLPRINCPKTSSITKKGNCKNTGRQPLASHRHSGPPSTPGDGGAEGNGGQALRPGTNCSWGCCVAWGLFPALSS